jgi:hypothetical protein
MSRPTGLHSLLQTKLEFSCLQQAINPFDFHMSHCKKAHIKLALRDVGDALDTVRCENFSGITNVVMTFTFKDNILVL